MSLLKSFHSVLNSKRYIPFFKGVTFQLGPGVTEEFRLVKVFKNHPKNAQRYSKHSYIAKISSKNHEVYGFGESNSKLLSVQKAISEGIERITMKSLGDTPLGSETSNGWACHPSLDQAKSNAAFEMIQRDGILKNWITKTPHFEIRSETFPKWLKKYSQITQKNKKYNKLRVFITSEGIVQSAIAALFSDDGHCIISGGCSPDLKSSIESALYECSRLVDIVEKEKWIESSKRLLAGNPIYGEKPNPLDHSVYYAKLRHLHSSFFGNLVDYIDVSRRIEHEAYSVQFFEDFNFDVFQIADLFVVKAKNSNLQDLFFGSTKEAIQKNLINETRIGIPIKQYNLLPHGVA